MKPNNHNTNEMIKYIRTMKNFDPREILEKVYDSKRCYNHLLSHAISMGEYDLVQRFLENVPNTTRKGNLSGIMNLVPHLP